MNSKPYTYPTAVLIVEASPTKNKPSNTNPNDGAYKIIAEPTTCIKNPYLKAFLLPITSDNLGNIIALRV